MAWFSSGTASRKQTQQGASNTLMFPSKYGGLCSDVCKLCISFVFHPDVRTSCPSRHSTSTSFPSIPPFSRSPSTVSTPHRPTRTCLYLPIPPHDPGAFRSIAFVCFFPNNVRAWLLRIGLKPDFGHSHKHKMRRKWVEVDFAIRPPTTSRGPSTPRCHAPTHSLIILVSSNSSTDLIRGIHGCSRCCSCSCSCSLLSGQFTY